MKGLRLVSLVVGLVFVGLLFMTSQAYATQDIPFSDNFEDKELNLGDKWFLGGTGTGTSTANVVELNTWEGHLRQSGAHTPLTVDTAVWASTTLGNTFEYTPGLYFSFDMAANAVLAFGNKAKARAGVDFQFLNILGTPIDSIGLMYATYTLPEKYLPILDSAHHIYSFGVGDLMTTAGLSTVQMAQVKSISMQFEATSQRYMHSGPTYDSFSDVWVDNVTVTPEPVSSALFLVGGGAMLFSKRRKRKKS